MFEQVLVASPAADVYQVHRLGQRPIEGVAVYYYRESGQWLCEADRRMPRGTMPDCEHIRAAKQYAQGRAA